MGGGADPAGEMREEGKAFLHAGHSDEQDADVFPVEDAAYELYRVHRKALGLIENQQFDIRVLVVDYFKVVVKIQMPVDAIFSVHDVVAEQFLEIAQRFRD